MTPKHLVDRYKELQQYVGWSEDDVRRVKSLATIVEPRFPELVDDFYDEIQRHPDALKVITGGKSQIERLKGTLTQWLRELLSGPYNADYVTRRWRVGYRHVEIGLDQVYTNAALSRLRRGLVDIVEEHWPGSEKELLDARRSLNTLIDLDLAIIEDAYQAEYLERQQQTERLATIGQVAGGIAHELRNPLNVIKTSVYYLLNARQPSPEKTAEHLNRIGNQVGRADGVITALSNFAKLPLPNLQPFAVEPFLQEAVDAAALPPDIQTRVDCAPGLPDGIADVSQLHIVLGNLLRNAHDAMPNGGWLTLRAAASGKHLDISVSDTGDGIAPDNLERIMQPLFTTKSRGIGLGLAMARAIVEKSEGELFVESVPGQGATFTVRLHAADGSTGEQL